MWKDIPDYAGSYQVSDTGQVRNKHEYVMRQRIRANYWSVTFNDGKSHSVHTLVAKAFIGPRPSGMYVLHNDGNSLNNMVKNLRYGSPADNVADAQRHGTWKQGFEPGKSLGVRLTSPEVLAIVDLLRQDVSQQEIAERYGVEQTTISHIKLGKNWSWLTNIRRN